jgi:hypothetical protein
MDYAYNVNFLNIRTEGHKSVSIALKAAMCVLMKQTARTAQPAMDTLITHARSAQKGRFLKAGRLLAALRDAILVTTRSATVAIQTIYFASITA